MSKFLDTGSSRLLRDRLEAIADNLALLEGTEPDSVQQARVSALLAQLAALSRDTSQVTRAVVTAARQPVRIKLYGWYGTPRPLLTWDQIGSALGVTKQSAQAKYRTADKPDLSRRSRS